MKGKECDLMLIKNSVDLVIKIAMMYVIIDVQYVSKNVCSIKIKSGVKFLLLF